MVNHLPNGAGRLARLAAASELEGEPTVTAHVERRPLKRRRPKKILVLDIGGSNVKMFATGHGEEVRKFPSGRKLTAEKMVAQVLEETRDWEYEAVSIGYPGVVGDSGPRLEPKSLGPCWVGFDFAAAFGKPVKMVNDAAMQALGSYEGGRMLFLGLGTNLGSSLISERVIFPLELGALPYKDGKTINDALCKSARQKVGTERWQQALTEIVALLKNAFAVDYVMLGGGNAKRLSEVPPGARLGGNANALLGGARLWNLALPIVKAPNVPRPRKRTRRPDWRVL